jgi:acyl-coenzyme A synthetase/AMP-(fatty) acid ligase
MEIKVSVIPRKGIELSEKELKQIVRCINKEIGDELAVTVHIRLRDNLPRKLFDKLSIESIESKG